MRVVDCVQRSEEWRLARCGHLTASRAHVILARGRKGGDSLQRLQYRRQLIFERLTGIPDEDGPPPFVSTAMRRGVEKEPAARAAYALQTGRRVKVSGFIAHDELPIGCSLDGHVDEFTGILRVPGVVEVKAPNTATHLDYLTSGRIPARYRAQLAHHLMITGAAWCDFVSFDDRLPAPMHLFVLRVGRDDVDVAGYTRAATQFAEELLADVRALERMDVEALSRAALRQMLCAFVLRTAELQRAQPALRGFAA